MKYHRLILPSLGLAALAWTVLREHDSRAQPAASGLPGARPAIEAIGYPTLQAAIDALPPEGGSFASRPGHSRSPARCS